MASPVGVLRPETAEERALWDAKDALGPKACKKCGAVKPRGAADWLRHASTADRLDSTCKLCFTTRARAWMAAKRAKRQAAREGRAVPTPFEQVLRSKATTLPQLPAVFNFRGILLDEIKPDWAAICRQIVKLAKAGQPQMLRQVTQIVLEGDDDDSAARFWQIVVAGAAESRATRPDAAVGDPADGPAAPDDLGDDRVYADAGSVDGA